MLVLQISNCELWLLFLNCPCLIFALLLGGLFLLFGWLFIVPDREYEGEKCVKQTVEICLITITSFSKYLLGAIKKYDWKALGQNFSSCVPWLVGAQTFMKRGKSGIEIKPHFDTKVCIWGRKKHTCVLFILDTFSDKSGEKWQYWLHMLCKFDIFTQFHNERIPTHFHFFL